MDDLYDAFDLEGHDITFSLHSGGERKAHIGRVDVRDIDCLYFTQRIVTSGEMVRIRRIMKQSQEEINKLLSNYI